MKKTVFLLALGLCCLMTFPLSAADMTASISMDRPATTEVLEREDGGWIILVPPPKPQKLQFCPFDVTFGGDGGEGSCVRECVRAMGHTANNVQPSEALARYCINSVCASCNATILGFWERHYDDEQLGWLPYAACVSEANCTTDPNWDECQADCASRMQYYGGL